jgi:uncharacterized RDD family membrane protein YckC
VNTSLVACEACGTEVSPLATSCPRCGHPGPAAAAIPSNLASWGQRVGAYLLDMGVIFGIGGVLMLLQVSSPTRITTSGDGTVVMRGWSGSGALLLMILTIAAVLLYKPLMEGAYGQTLGKRWVGIKVVDEDLKPIGYGIAFGRWAVGLLINVIPLAGLVNHLWPLWDERNQTLHDKAARTLVITAN